MKKVKKKDGGWIGWRISPSVIHLMRGQVFTIEAKKIFTFGGARIAFGRGNGRR